MEYNENNASIPLVLTYKGTNKGYPKTTPRGTGIIIEQTEASKDVKLLNFGDLFTDNILFVCENPFKSYKEVLIDLNSSTYIIGNMRVSSKYDLLEYYNKNILPDSSMVDDAIKSEYKQKTHFKHLTKNIFKPDVCTPIFADEVVYNNIFTNVYNYMFKQEFKLTVKTCLLFPFLFPETEIILYPKEVRYIV